jgi:hypothetical protein
MAPEAVLVVYFQPNSVRVLCVPTIYFDYNATTPLDPQVREAMLPYLGEVFGQSVECASCGTPRTGVVG